MTDTSTKSISLPPEFLDKEALEGVAEWLKSQELSINVGCCGDHELEGDTHVESSAGWLLRLVKVMSGEPSISTDIQDCYFELAGIHADIAAGGLNAFDDTCLQTLTRVMAKLASLNAVRIQPELEVWYGSMPESNGKSNWTALLRRKGDSLVTGPSHTIDRSEYPDRVRYHADQVRYIIGELAEEPCILDYDGDKCDSKEDES